MPTLQEVVQTHLELSGKSIRALAKEAKITYPTLLGVVNRGSVPRKAEHRDSLRLALEVDEEEWNEILMASTTNGMAITPGRTQTLQQLISQKMYSRGMTEQQLAEQADVAYSTVMGITRKGSIPREDSLNSVVDVLGLEPEEVRAAIGASRAMRRTGIATDRIEQEPEEILGLAQVVGKHIRSRGQSMGSFAEDLGVGYFALSRFLETGVPPEDEAILQSLQKMLGLSKKDFATALDKGRAEPEPAELGPQDELLGENANPLQQAMVNYMRENDLTLKALAKRADLSQVTVSRLVKQGQAPTRATTHIKLQELLGLSPDRYQGLVSHCQPESAALLSNEPADDEETDSFAADDSYEPQGISEEEQRAVDSGPQSIINPAAIAAAAAGNGGVPTKDELIALVKKLGPKQREALKTFLAAMV